MRYRLIVLLFLTISSGYSSFGIASDFSEIFELHDDVMLLIEPDDGHIIDANISASHFYGYSQTVLRSMRIQDINLMTAEEVAQERALAKKQQRNLFIFRHKLSNGLSKTVEVTSTPVSYQGKMVLLSIIRDLSYRGKLHDNLWHYHEDLEDVIDDQELNIRNKNEQLIVVLSISIASLIIVVTGLIISLYRQRQAKDDNYRLSQIVQQSPLSVVRTDVDGNIDYVNKQFELSSGYVAEEVLGKKPSILKSGKTSDSEYEELWKTITQGNVWVGEFHNVRKDGEHFWEKATIGPVRSINNEISHFIALKEDITELKKGEKRLRLAATVFESASEAVMVTDADNKIQAVNKAFTDITGYSAEEAMGQDPGILASGHHDEAFYQQMLTSLKETDNWQGEIWNRRKNGEIYTEWLAITATRDSRGKLENYVSLFSDITKRKENEVRIQFQANYDSLTGLANRTLFGDRFSQALKHAQREKHQVALLYLDLDGFKHVNDTLGHSKGDALLKEVATRLVSSLRKSDTVARLGGDEFVILMPDGNSIKHIEHMAMKVQESISVPYSLDGHDAFVSASIGITVYPDDGEDTETLMRKADSAMYKAKASGRNNFQFFTVEMDKKAQQRRELEHDLRRALEHDEFSVYFQPVMDVSKSCIAGAEALIRWHHPEKGLIPPNDFIPLAEDIGLIVPIGEWVLRQACLEAVKWHQQYHNAPRVAVNLSSHQFQRGSIFNLTKEILAETGLSPQQLILEITESVLISDDVATLTQLQALRGLGVDLSIDDFGTGYSSLSYLKKFPITALKIDRSFVMDVTTNQEDEVLIKAIVSMAKSLNLKVVAEGVETNEQVNLLQQIDCQYIQGYFYSKPLPKDDFLSYCQQRLQAKGSDA